MDSLIEKIVEKLQHLPEPALQKIIDFVDFLTWQSINRDSPSLSVAGDDLQEEHEMAWLETDLSNLGSYESYDWQPGEIGEGLPVKYIPGMGLVIVEK